MTTQELIDYYVNLLIAQYRDQGDAQGTVAAMVQEIIASQIIQQVEDGFDVATAVGVQLDAIGTYRGAERNIVGTDLTRSYFSMPSYGGSETGVKGFSVYGGDNSWYFLTYEDAASEIYTMNDTELRTLIQLKAALQSSTLGVGEIDAILYEFFGTAVTLVDNFDMTIEYQCASSFTGTLFTIVTDTNSLPNPAGVGVTYAVV